MVSTKRRIEKDTDRQGGYGTEIVRSPLISEYDKIYTDLPSNNSVVPEPDLNITSVPNDYQSTIYTSAPSAAPVTDLPSRPEKATKRREREDILPTVKTRAYAENKQEVERDEQAEAVARPARRVKHSLDGKTKIMLCVYVVIALVLAIAVIATGVTISSASAEANVISERIAERQAVIVEQQQTLATLRDDNAIRGKAMENGMVQAGSPSYNVTPTETVEYPNAEPHSNGFDEFCDWLSKVIG